MWRCSDPRRAKFSSGRTSCTPWLTPSSSSRSVTIPPGNSFSVPTENEVLGARGSRQAARTGRHPRHGAAHAVSEVSEQEAMTVAKTHGAKRDGTPVTDQMIEALADEAELGYDVDELRTRNKGGRPAMGEGGSLCGIGTTGSRAQARPASTRRARADKRLRRHSTSPSGVRPGKLIHGGQRLFCMSCSVKHHLEEASLPTCSNVRFCCRADGRKRVEY